MKIFLNLFVLFFSFSLFAEWKENTWVAEYNEGIGSIASVNGLVTHGDRFYVRVIKSDTGSCDMSIVNTVVMACPKDKPVLIKSTISLEGWEVLEGKRQICFSPEFLTAANANEDFKKQKFMLFGGDNIDFWEDVFILAKGFKPVYGTIRELILTKYLRNSFLATKVAFFNEVNEFCKNNNIDYNNVAEMVGMDERITRSHMQIPGPDGDLGFGGACFPKDTMALLLTGIHYKTPFSILRQVVESNKRIRNE